MTAPLTIAEVEQFVRNGFVPLREAFPRALADRCREGLWAALGLDPLDACTWQRPVVRLPGSDAPPFVEAANTPRLLAWATGEAGDVYLCHPFLVHAATWPHRGKTPRFIAQPPLTPVGLLDLDRADSDYSPVEIAVRIGLGLEHAR